MVLLPKLSKNDMNATEPVTADILIVDDTLENLELLSEMLTQEGYEVRIVKTKVEQWH